MKTFKTQKGTELPLASLKGKDYLLIAHRLLWLSEEATNYDITTDFLVINDEQTVARATVTLFDVAGNTIRKATATKRETKKDFPDHTEKAETGAMGRALAMLGFGTQFAQQDLEEGDRLADAPLEAKKSVPKPKAAAHPTEAEVGGTATTASPTPMAAAQDTDTITKMSGSTPSTTRTSSFRRDAQKPVSNGGGWS